MTEPPPPRPYRGPRTLADLAAGEGTQVQAGDLQGCGASCPCHGGHTCIRGAHPHEPGQVAPHVGQLDDGSLVQWVCTDPDTRSPEEAAAEAAADRAAATRQLLATLDLDVLREHLSLPGGADASGA